MLTHARFAQITRVTDHNQISVDLSHSLLLDWSIAADDAADATAADATAAAAASSATQLITSFVTKSPLVLTGNV